jgi:F0F1-type ATP synthase membrane subunit c/vacuolar-type H+-ATPase subunit K
MPPSNQPPPTVDGALRISTVIWVAMMVTQGLLLLVARFASPPAATALEPMPAYAILGVAILAVVASYIVKGRLIAQAAAKQNIQGVLSARIVALAMCEVAGLFGLVVYFLFVFPYYFVFFALAVVGMLGHFPRRSEFDAAAAPRPIL